MKKISTLAALTLMASTAMARPLTPAEALTRVETQSGYHAKERGAALNPTPLMEIKAAGNKTVTAVYVFSDGRDRVIFVSGDDIARPLLGYTDSGDFNQAEMPPQLQGWLDFYASQIAWGEKNGYTSAPDVYGASTGKNAIAPMTKSKWNQGAPYNEACPLDNGKRSVTGCVATAMAQAMYYHQWPQTGTGSHSYKWNGQELSVDFGSTTYDWADMTDTYDDKSTEAAKEAVANLMYSCGVSVDMNYSSDESGASSFSMLDALYKYFGYDKSMAMPQRSYYGDEAWNDMVYDQLTQGLPVLYGGQSYEGGHQFICDGYDGDGYFHFNWGWGGMSDGYFLLSALNPLNQGIGGSASDSGFNYDQCILINMKKAESGSSVTPLIYCYGNFGTTATGSVNLGDEVKFNGDYFNFACAEIEGYIGIKIVDQAGNTSYIRHEHLLDFPTVSGYGNYTVTLPTDLAAGTYTVTPVFMVDGTTDWIDILCPLSGVQQLSMSVSDGQATFSDDITNSLTVTNFTLNTPIYLDENFSTTFTVTNTGTTEYFGEYLLYLFDENGEEVAPSSDINTMDLMPGESTTITYVSKFPTSFSTDDGTVTVQPGTYILGLFSHFTKQQIYIYDTPVSVADAPAETTLEVTSLEINGGNPVVDTGDIKFSGTVECTEGYFGGRLTVAIFKDGTSSTSITGKTDYMFVNQGESVNFTADVNLSDGVDGEKYFAVVFKDDSQISNAYYFELTASGVKAISASDGIQISKGEGYVRIASEKALTGFTIYNIDGVAVYRGNLSGETEIQVDTDALGHGEYIVTAQDMEGHVASEKIVK